MIRTKNYLIALACFIFMSHSPVHANLIELLCVGGFRGESERKEFQLAVSPADGFMWGFDPFVAIGFFNVDDKSKPFARDFKCEKHESAYQCSGSNSIGLSSAELSRYSGVLKITTALKKDKNLFISEFKCDTPPKRKF